MDPVNELTLPDELRAFEAKLVTLAPKKDPDFVRSVLVFAPGFDERIPYPVTSSSFRQFTRFVRKAQYTAGLFGGLVGSLFGAVLGGLCVFFAMSSPQLLSNGPVGGSLCADARRPAVTQEDRPTDLAQRIQSRNALLRELQSAEFRL